MPQPRPGTAFPTAAAVAAQGLTVDQVDPDYLKFLQYVRVDGNSYSVKRPAHGASPPTPTAKGEAQSAPSPTRSPAGSGRAVEQEIPPAGGLPWYETMAGMDENYRQFWRQARFEDGLLVLHVEDKVVRYGLDAVPARLSVTADGPEKKGVEEAAAVADLGEDSDSVWVGDEEKETVEPIRTDGPATESRVFDSCARWQKRKAEQGQEEKGEGKGDTGKIKVVKGEEKMLNELPVGTLSTVNTETKSSNGHGVEPQIASGSYGVVWPTHIMERPDSSFKKRLLRDLRRPFSMVECSDLLLEAKNRRPATKIRQTRTCVKFYNSPDELNQSYFDSHPDLEKQVLSTSYPNQLALLRGFFFWLKNVTNDDQFRPWTDDFRQYTIIPRE